MGTYTSNVVSPRFDHEENLLFYSGADSTDNSLHGRYVFSAAAALLASYFYALPFIKMPWGYLSYMRLDDIMTVVFLVFVAFGAKNEYQTHKTVIGKFIVLIIFGLLFSYIIARLFFRVFWLYRLYGIWTTGRYIHYIVVFFLAARVIYSSKRLNVLMWVIFFGGLFVAVYGLARYYGYISPYHLAEMFEESGAFEMTAEIEWSGGLIGPLSQHHAYTALMLGTSLFFTLALLHRGGVLSKLVLLAGATVIVFAMVLTKARAPLYALPVAVLARMLLLKGKVRSFFLSVLVLSVAYFAVTQIPELQARFFLAGGLEESTGGARLRGWMTMLGWLGRNPTAWLTGVGFGNWQGVVRLETGFNAAHNNYLHFLIEGGAIGFVVFLLAIGIALKHTYQIAKSQIPMISQWGQAMFGTVVFLVFSAFTQENFVPSGSLGSFLGFFMFLCGVTYWAKQYVDRNRLLLSEWDYSDSGYSPE